MSAAQIFRSPRWPRAPQVGSAPINAKRAAFAAISAARPGSGRAALFPPCERRRRAEFPRCPPESASAAIRSDRRKGATRKDAADRYRPDNRPQISEYRLHSPCLLYTSDAADEEDSVDLGGRR